MARYIDADQLAEMIKAKVDMLIEGKQAFLYVEKWLEHIPTADVVEVDTVSEQIIRKKAAVSDYWQNYVKQYRSMQGYSDIEHDADNFLRGYNEAVEDMLAILDGKKRKENGNDKS